MPAKPLIGIQVRKLAEQNEYRLNHKYSEAIYAGGSIPIMLPLIPARDYLEAVLAKLDGIVMSGCYSDIDPKLYAETAHPKLGQLSEVRDQFDWLLLEYAHEQKIPLMGICRGFQALNVYRGGNLIQDLSSQKPESLQLEEHYIFGVQWHPERTWEVDEFSLSIFRNFTQEVVARKTD